MFLVGEVEKALAPLRAELVTRCLTCGDILVGARVELGNLPFNVCDFCVREGAVALGYIDREDFDD